MAELLSTKRTVLSNPGSKRTDLYYTKLNTSIEQVEATFSMGRLKMAISSPTLGGQALVTVPNSSFLGECFLHLELPATVANQTLCRGWGWGVIDHVSYLFGSSNISQLQLSGQSIWQTISAQCESSEKRNECFRLGGQEVLTAGVIPKADLLIPLPFSTMCANSKKYFDTNLLDAPITITIQFKQSSAIYGGSGLRPSQFQRAEVSFRQGDLENKANSLRNALMSQPDMMLSYPFIHHQSAPTVRVTAANGTDEQSVVLQGFINADLVALTLSVVKSTDVTPVSNNSASPFNFQDLEDVVIDFNGTSIYDTSGLLYKLVNCLSIPGSGYWHNSVIQPGATGPFSSDPVDSYTLIVDFSRIRSLCYEGEYQNVQRIGNQVLNFRFKIPSAAGEEYIIYPTYHYNGVSEVQRGSTNIFFN